MNFLLLLMIAFGSSNVSSMDLFDAMEMAVQKNPQLEVVELSAKDIRSIKETVRHIYDDGVQESKNTQGKNRDIMGYRPKDLYLAYFKLIKKLYLNGRIRSNIYESWIRDYKKLLNKAPPSGVKEEDFWLGEYQSVFNKLLTRAKLRQQVCAGVGELASAKKCCPGLIKFSDLSFDSSSSNSCQRDSLKCSKNSECCSGACNQEDPDKPGTCVRSMKCYEVHRLGEKCSQASPFCGEGKCFGYNKKFTNALQCQYEGKLCSSNSDCCSDLCENKKCSSNKRCLKCQKEGVRLKTGEKCCPGYIETKDKKCIAPLPVFDPTVKLESFKDYFLKLSSLLFFPAAHAKEEGSAQVATSPGEAFTPAELELLDRERDKCLLTPSKAEEGSDCLESVKQLSAQLKEAKYTGLTQSQMDSLDVLRQGCTDNFSTTITCIETDPECMEGLKENPPHKACMIAADEEKKVFLKLNAKNGELGVSLTKSEYLTRYKIPAITAKTYSDVTKCEFNSLNDSWRDASFRERNSEVFLRSFEYVFSHKGTQDYWVDGSRGNIFSRARRVAQEFRDNRSKLVLEMKRIDNVMACKCLGIFGASNFSSEKRKYFDVSCDEEKRQLRATLGEGFDQEGTLETKEASEIARIDKGAIGLSKEHMLVEWLHLRADAQVLRFVDNSDLERQLTELSTYIDNVNFSEVYKDKIVSNRLVKSIPEGNTEPLYRWGYDFYRGGYSFALAVGGAFVSIITAFPTAVYMVGKGIYEYITAGKRDLRGDSANPLVLSGMYAAWKEDTADGIKAMPQALDIKEESNSKKDWNERYNGYRKYFLGPKFSNGVVGDNSCLVMGRASACLRSAYRVNKVPGVFNYLIDPTLPLFVDPTRISTRTMPGSQYNWISMINDASRLGVLELKKTRPNDGKLKGKYYETDAKEDFIKRDMFQEKLARGFFLPLQGNYQEVEFGTRKSLIIDGAKKYAKCKNLTTDFENGCAAVGVPVEAIGFGYLFETDTEIAQWADYTFENHYKGPSLSKENYMGYPSADLGQYFRNVAGNMKRLGSISSSRALQYGEAATLYEEDFTQRKSDYNVVLGTAQTGTRSRNIKFSPAFFAEFAKLEFKGETNLEAFDSSLSAAVSGGRLSKAEVSTLGAARSSAVRRNIDIKKKNDLDKALLKSSNLTKKAFAANSGALKSINSPLSSFGLRKLGAGGNGFAKLPSGTSGGAKINGKENSNLGAKAFNSNLGSFSSSSTSPRGASFSPYYYGASTVGSSAGSSEGAGTGLGEQQMSGEQVEQLLENLKSDKTLLPSENDSLFSIVSKAYKRSYSRVLKRRESSKKELLGEPKGEELQDEKKEKLRQLLKE